MLASSVIELPSSGKWLSLMNYRHAYHAGNFADVLKHIVLARCLASLKDKPAPFRVIDTHAGLGIYDLASHEAKRTAESLSGIAKLEGSNWPDDIAALLAPYRDAIFKTRAHRGDTAYPGSPAIIEALLRPEDRLIANELHLDDFKALRDAFAFDGRVKCLSLDASVALNASIPPKERRGLVLIDPPFEERDEFSRLVDMIARAHRKWETGIYAVWYPVKSISERNRFFKDLKDTGIKKILRIEQAIDEIRDGGPLSSSGLIVINPPWRLADEMKLILPWLDPLLAIGSGHYWCVEWLVREAQSDRDL